MYFKTITATLTAGIFSLFFSLALASQHGSMEGHQDMDHSTMSHEQETHAEMNHSAMDQEQPGHAMQAMGVGVIHRVSRLNHTVNLTHEPIPALNWPAMTMDLPVDKSVDLGKLKSGQKVHFHLKLDADKKYMITEIMDE